MKNNERYLLVAIIILLSAILGYSIYKYTGAKAEAKDFKHLADNRLSMLFNIDDKVRIYKDSTKMLHAKLDDIKVFYEKEIAALKHVIGVKDRHIKTIVASSIIIKDTLSIPILLTDTIVKVKKDTIFKSFEYHDEWADISAQQSIFWWHIQYNIRDTISFVISSKNKFFRREYSIHGISHNPNTEISGIEAIHIRERNKRFGLGPFIGIDNYGKIRYGVGLNFNLIKF